MRQEEEVGPAGETAGEPQGLPHDDPSPSHPACPVSLLENDILAIQLQRGQGDETPAENETDSASEQRGKRLAPPWARSPSSRPPLSGRCACSRRPGSRARGLKAPAGCHCTEALSVSRRDCGTCRHRQSVQHAAAAGNLRDERPEAVPRSQPATGSEAGWRRGADTARVPAGHTEAIHGRPRKPTAPWGKRHPTPHGLSNPKLDKMQMTPPCGNFLFLAPQRNSP